MSAPRAGLDPAKDKPVNVFRGLTDAELDEHRGNLARMYNLDPRQIEVKKEGIHAVFYRPRAFAELDARGNGRLDAQGRPVTQVKMVECFTIAFQQQTRA